MAKPVGRCRLCGYSKKLTPEHIPPQAAFNDNQVVFETMQDAFGLSGRKYSKFRGGIQKTSLCESCNNNTGDWYAKAFIEWVKQGFELVDKVKGQGNTALALPFHIYPLNVLKQIITMSLATISEERIDFHEELRSFVLNRHQKYLPPPFRVFVYFNKKGGRPRLIDKESVIARTDIGAIAYEFVNTEIALPPFGYCVTLASKTRQKSLAESLGLFDITWFGEYGYNVWIDVGLPIPVRETHEPFPLDYRTMDEVTEHSMKNGI